MYDLQRYKKAQNTIGNGIYMHEKALAELLSGRKETHCMWYTFPQLKGILPSFIKESQTSKTYALKSGDEACAYLKDPLLFARYKSLLNVVQQQLNKGVSIYTLMGGSPDDVKFKSSITLFNLAATHLESISIVDAEKQKYKKLKEVSISILNQIKSQGYLPCENTLKKATFKNVVVIDVSPTNKTKDEFTIPSKKGDVISDDTKFKSTEPLEKGNEMNRQLAFILKYPCLTASIIGLLTAVTVVGILTGAGLVSVIGGSIGISVLSAGCGMGLGALSFFALKNKTGNDQSSTPNLSSISRLD